MLWFPWPYDYKRYKLSSARGTLNYSARTGLNVLLLQRTFSPSKFFLFFLCLSLSTDHQLVTVWISSFKLLGAGGSSFATIVIMDVQSPNGKVLTLNYVFQSCNRSILLL